MEGANVSMPYQPQNETRSLFNNPKMSDVRFLVDGQTVYGHKVILGMGSPVFERMFFGELKEQREVIEIKDQSLVGFKNALRYIYGHPIDYPLTDLYESYLAADKYLLHHFNKPFFEYIRIKLNAENGCLIYDQLLKIGDQNQISLCVVITTINFASEIAFKSDYFKQIDQETLVKLLSEAVLTIAEFNLFKEVSKWVDCEVQRRGLSASDENRRKVFEPIKSYVLFTALTPERIGNCQEIAQLLTFEERGSLLLHLMNTANRLTFEVKTPRRPWFAAVRRVFSEPSGGGSFCSNVVHLTVNRRVAIRTIHSAYSEIADLKDLSLKVLDLNGVDLGLKIDRLVKEGMYCFSFSPPFYVEPNNRYTLKITGIDDLVEGELSKQTQLNYKGYVNFDLSFPAFPPFLDHYIRSLEFLTTD